MDASGKGLQAEREALAQLMTPLTPAGWTKREDTSGVTLRWTSGHQEEIVVRAEVLAHRPVTPIGIVGGVWPLGSGWLQIDCWISNPRHPRCWAAAKQLVAQLQPQSPSIA